MKKQWMLGIIFILFCVSAVMVRPVHVEAASQSEQNAYRAVFDASYYYNANPDVAAVCGTDEALLFKHFVIFGVSEGRSASAEFNPQAYRQRYTDLQQAFGNNMAAYCTHYIVYGRSEGRCATVSGQMVAPVQSKPVVRESATQKIEKTEETKKETATEDKNEAKETVAEADKNEAKETVAEDKNKETAKKETATEDKNEAKTEEIKKVKAQQPLKATVTEAAPEIVRTAQEEETTEEMQPAREQVVGTYTTVYEQNESRAVNVEVGAHRINGVVVQPGGRFSFNDTVLARTVENGYAEGPVFVKGKEVQGIGGGVCQVSSTLYAAMIKAQLPATERHPHSMPVDYVPAEMDATIAGDYLDLKFVNTFERPLQILAQTQGGTLTVTLVLL